VERFQVSLGALHRHKIEHILQAIQKAHEAGEVLRAARAD
jgi:hypothetical protein